MLSQKREKRIHVLNSFWFSFRKSEICYSNVISHSLVGERMMKSAKIAILQNWLLSWMILREHATRPPHFVICTQIASAVMVPLPIHVQCSSSATEQSIFVRMSFNSDIICADFTIPWSH